MTEREEQEQAYWILRTLPDLDKERRFCDLVNAGTRVSSAFQPNPGTWPLLHLAAIYSPPILKFILEKMDGQQHIDLQCFGWTPLMAATNAANIESVELLVRHGANRDLIDDDGRTPAEIALAKEHQQVYDLLSVKPAPPAPDAPPLAAPA